MIATKCPYCDTPVLVNIGPGAFCPHECDDCGEIMVIEMTRMDGTTFPEDKFVEEVLPTLDEVERVDHPDADVHIYANPDNIGFKTPE